MKKVSDDKQPTYNQVVADLKAANAEVRDVINTNAILKKENAAMKRHIDGLEYQVSLIRAALAVHFKQGN